ncbi:MAG: DUF4956 domain-containing protein [Clostridia bacterium]|nr:DUF4956 domain-containing protein [Clostridia bacterium]
MLESILGTTMTGSSVAICTAASLLLGCLIALVYKLTNKDCTSHFLVALLLLPALVQCVIMMVNGNLGAGVAVAGAFSLVRFRSAQGSAQEICIIFLAMAVGLTNGMGYVAFATAFTALMMAVFFIACKVLFSQRVQEKHLKILIAEDVDYMTAFEDLFKQYTAHHRLVRTKTTNMGSLYQLTYRVRIKDPAKEKEMLDAIRCRNGNLTVSLIAAVPEKETL